METPTSRPAAFDGFTPSRVWNTHRAIRTKFGYPQDSEFFGEWLMWFYSLNASMRTALRNTDLNKINVDDYPSRPAVTKEKT